MKNGLLYLILFLGPLGLSAQSEKQFIKKAHQLHEAGVWIEAAPMYITLLQQQYNEDHARKLVDCFMGLAEYTEAEWWMSGLVTEHPADSALLRDYADLLKRNGKYLSAKEYYLRYAQFDPSGYYFAGTCDFAVNRRNEQMIALRNLSVNTAASEMTPSYYRNGLLYASNSPGQSEGVREPSAGGGFFDLYYVVSGSDGKLSMPQTIRKSNSGLHDAAAAYSGSDNRLYFTRSDFYKKRERRGKDNKVHLSIYSGIPEEGKLRKVKPLPFNSKQYSTAHPALSPSGDLLIFSSDRPGGVGGADLYFSTYSEDGWSDPVNMGEVVNTPGDEYYPFIDTEGRLWFASDYHPGYGGLDLFYTERKDGHWTQPVNAGLPVNSSYDDYSLITDGFSGYFTSNRPDGRGSDDIYGFTRMRRLEGITLINSKLQPVADVRVILFEDDHRLEAGYSDAQGMVALPMDDPEATYSVSLIKEGYIENIVYNLNEYASNTGYMTVFMQELYGVNETEETFDDNADESESVEEVADTLVYNIYIGTFTDPDYTKLTSLARFGELSVRNTDTDELEFLLLGLKGKAKAEEALKAALAAGFTDAEILSSE